MTTSRHDLLTLSQAAEVLGITRQAIYDAVARERLPAERLGPILFVRKRDLTKYQKSRKPGRPPKTSR